MAPVNLVTIHHEGAGSPSDVARGADGGYTYWIGATRYERLRDVWHSYATLGFNHVSLDICLSGNRMVNLVTNNDIALIRNAVAEARALGYVGPAPMVRAHRNSPGSSTVCPGSEAMSRWNEIVAACTQSASPTPPPPPPKVAPMYNPPIAKSLGITAVWEVDAVVNGRPTKVVLAAVAPNGDTYCWGVPQRAWPTKATDFAGRTAARIQQSRHHGFPRYEIVDTAGEVYEP